MPPPSDTKSAALLAGLCACSMIAVQVAAKATRDALFLSNFEVTLLPQMVIAASGLGIIVVLLMAKAMSTLGPKRLVPICFALSGIAFFAEYLLAIFEPEIAAVLLYLHVAAGGAILISGFWSLVGEHFDPRTAKRQISRIGAGATLGGLLGGLLAERIAALWTLTGTLPLLSLLHFVCATLLLRFGRKQHPNPKQEQTSGLGLLVQRPYLLQLALLAGATTIAAGLLDYVFKASAATTYTDGEQLMRFFAIFYTSVGLAGFVVQALLGRPILERLGLTKATGALPAMVGTAAAASMLSPTLITVGLARATEYIIRNSSYRSGAELFYTPVRPAEKRATKQLIDVGCDRLGDAAAAGLVFLILITLPRFATPLLLILSVLFCMGALYVIHRLGKGYVRELETALRDRADELNLIDLDETMTKSTILKTMGRIDIAQFQSNEAFSSPSPPENVPDPLVEKINQLRSGDREQVLDALAAITEEETSLVPHVIPLIAWDAVRDEAITMLTALAEQHTDILVERLLDEQEAFAVRRRLPLVLATIPNEQVAAGLSAALLDKRFEVRYQAGRALARTRAPVNKELLSRAITKEVEVDRRVWDSRRLLDEVQEGQMSRRTGRPGGMEVQEGRMSRAASDEELIDTLIEDRAERSLEHVFRLLSLILDPIPLRTAYRGLHTEDSMLRGTALEYLESVLPEPIRIGLWPFLEDNGERPISGSRQEILDALMQSHSSIEMNLRGIRASDQEEESET